MMLPPLRLTSGDPIADRRVTYAHGLADDGDPVAAADLMAQAMALVPGWAAGWFLLGEWRLAAKDSAGAIAAWERARALDPSDALGAGIRIDLTRQVPLSDTLPPAFVRTLYDAYAPQFETSLVATLAYRGPDMLRDALLAIGRTQFPRVMDLGCGTGLMGVAIRPHAGWLAGCDLSPGMLQQAAQKQVYDQLLEQDIASLRPAAVAYDLILAADVFIYLGALEQVVGWAAASLTPDGVLAFTVEALPDAAGDVVLQPSCRYAHSAAYLTRLLDQAGFAPPRLTAGILRMDRGAPVAGLSVTAARPATARRSQTDGEDLATV